MVGNKIRILALSALLGLGAAGSARAAGAKTKRYDGTVAAVNQAAGKIFLKLRDGSTGDWTVGPDTKVSAGTKASALSDVKPGDRVAAWVAEDGRIKTLKIVSEPMPGKAAAPAKKGEVDDTGSVSSVDAAKRRFSIVRGDNHRTVSFVAPAGAKVFLGPKEVPFSELRPGQTVRTVAENRHLVKILILEKK
jgi:hypothetical protein